MAGLYVHIPFCRKACHYCDFHFSTNLKLKSEMVHAICQEMEMRVNEWSGFSFDSIYFGGGTPSLLSESELTEIMESIWKNSQLKKDVEVTLEANPEDLSKAKLKTLVEVGINRLSIGIQTFQNQLLQFMNRNHDANNAGEVVKIARDSGIENINLDLIFGIPGQRARDWITDLQSLITLAPNHVSIYGLTIEQETVFGRWLKKGKLSEVDEETQSVQFEEAHERLSNAGYDHYEVSNYALPGFKSRHNSAYWTESPYFGVGPSAHSYSGNTRKRNVDHNQHYLDKIKIGELPAITEVLSQKQKINEYLMTRSRTRFGIDLIHLKEQYNIDLRRDRYTELSMMVTNGLIEITDQLIVTTSRGMMVADLIAEKLFYEE